MSKRIATLAEIETRRISAIIRTKDARLAADAMRAAVAGGFRVVEFTLTTPNAYELIAEFAKEPGLLIGAGTVMSPEQARDAVAAGASFLVSPVCDPAVIAEARALDAVSIPGTFTPNEMMAAHNAGADILKLFPAPPDVASYVTSVLGPLPHVKIFPTAGVDADNFLEVLSAGAFGVGFVRSLFVPADMAAGDMTAIERRAADITAQNKSVAPVSNR